MRRLWFTLMALAGPLLVASPVLAQSEGQTQSTMNVFQMFLWSDDLLGLAIIWLLVGLSMVCLALILMFAMKHTRSRIVPDDTAAQIEAMLAEKRYREAIDFAQSDPSFLGKLVSGALGEASNGYVAMERAIEEEADAEIGKMLRPIEFLNVLGAVAPMIGLFGTVYGMIRAFQALVEAGGRPDPAELAAGISTALVTTLWGLVVAIPALAGFAVIRNRIDVLTSEAILVAEDLIAPFKPGASGKKKARSQSAGE